MIARNLEIRKKYLKPPTPEEMIDFINEVGVGKTQFERFYNIPERTLVQAINGKRNLPVKFWPIFYERKIPAYGIEWLKENKDKIKTEEKPITKPVTKKSQSDNIKRLTDL
jgi:hypothetical protein